MKKLKEACVFKPVIGPVQMGFLRPRDFPGKPRARPTVSVILSTTVSFVQWLLVLCKVDFNCTAISKLR
jgi:hypothetical protein